MMFLPDNSPLKERMIFDTHAHYDDERFTEELDSLFEFLTQNGVSKVITCGCDTESSKKSLELAQKYDFVYAAVGYHPSNIDNGFKKEKLIELANNKKCIAIGEIGLDYYWTQDNNIEQREIFAKQLEIANELGLPVLVHDRDAHSDTLEILKKYKPKGVVHSFSGSCEMAEELIKLGMHIGIGGVITFKNAKKLPEVVKMLPEDRILLETDSPYLTPVPYRSKTNNSAMIYFIAEKIAEIRGTTTEHILNLTFNNASKLFKV